MMDNRTAPRISYSLKPATATTPALFQTIMDSNNDHHSGVRSAEVGSLALGLGWVQGHFHAAFSRPACQSPLSCLDELAPEELAMTEFIDRTQQKAARVIIPVHVVLVRALAAEAASDPTHPSYACAAPVDRSQFMYAVGLFVGNVLAAGFPPSLNPWSTTAETAA